MYLARDRDNSLHLFGAGSPPFFDHGVSQMSLEDNFAPYFGPIEESDVSDIKLKPETVIPVKLTRLNVRPLDPYCVQPAIDE